MPTDANDNRSVSDVTESLSIAPEHGASFALNALNCIHDGVVACGPTGIVRYLNPAAERLTGRSSASAQGQPLSAVMPLVDGSGTSLFDGDAWPRWDEREVDALTLTDLAGQSRPVRVTISDGADVIDDGVVVVVADSSREVVLRKQLNFHAHHDDLTGLPNRKAFETFLYGALCDAQLDPQHTGAMLYLDLDQFKVINDLCGHLAGDRFIVQLVQSLGERVRDSDVLARLGGDEFGVLLHDCTINSALQVAENLRCLIRDLNFSWQGKSYSHTASIGVVAINGGDASVASIMSAADIACFAAKDSGRDSVELYTRDNVPAREIEMQWVARVSRACDEQRFALYQQPIVALGKDDNDCDHYEILIRMLDRFGNIIMPCDFIPAAERYNLMPRIDRWMLDKTLRQLLWQPGVGKKYALSLNLSGNSLSDAAFREFVLTSLDTAQPEPGVLCFEITETAAIANIGEVVAFMHAAKARGCQFSLDDFGSGLSSFAYLKELPVDYLKIDGHFVGDLCADAASSALVEAFNNVGHALNIKTVAERVEDGQVAERLAQLGVDYAQGYHFAKPQVVHGRQGFCHPAETAPIAKLAG